MTKMSPEKESKSNALPKVLVNDEEEGVANAAGKHGILPASARFVVPASTAAASKLVLFDVMDTIVADPFFRGYHKVNAHCPPLIACSGCSGRRNDQEVFIPNSELCHHKHTMLEVESSHSRFGWHAHVHMSHDLEGHVY